MGCQRDPQARNCGARGIAACADQSPSGLPAADRPSVGPSRRQGERQGARGTATAGRRRGRGPLQTARRTTRRTTRQTATAGRRRGTGQWPSFGLLLSLRLLESRARASELPAKLFMQDGKRSLLLRSPPPIPAHARGLDAIHRHANCIEQIGEPYEGVVAGLRRLEGGQLRRRKLCYNRAEARLEAAERRENRLDDIGVKRRQRRADTRGRAALGGLRHLAQSVGEVCVRRE